MYNCNNINVYIILNRVLLCIMYVLCNHVLCIIEYIHKYSQIYLSFIYFLWYFVLIIQDLAIK